MTHQDILAMLWDLGHFRNPGMPTYVQSRDEALSMTLKDHDARVAIQSYQELMADNLDALTMKYHNRAAIVDGDLGPATVELFTLPRCGAPDYPEVGLLAEATGVGGWPYDCHPDYPGVHTLVVDVRLSGAPSSIREVWPQVWEMVRLAYADIGLVLIEAKEGERYQTRLTFERLRGSTIGLAIVPQRPPACSDTIWLKLDPGYTPGNLANQIMILLAHELGHNNRLGHTRGGIMNPGILTFTFTRTAWRGDPSFAKLARQYGGEPVDLGGPNPPPGPDDPRLVFRGSFSAEVDGVPLDREYILTPKPRV